MSTSRSNCGVVPKRFIKKYKSIIQAFDLCPTKNQELLLKHSDINLVKLVCEVSVNILYGIIHIDNKCKKKLNRFKKLLFFFSDKKTGLKSKQKTLKRNINTTRKFVSLIFKCILAFI